MSPAPKKKLPYISPLAGRGNIQESAPKTDSLAPTERGDTQESASKVEHPAPTGRENAQKSALKPELLAPAGDGEMLRAAVFSGADAVYLGLLRLNARRSAGNFSTEELRAAVSFCHARGVRVYVTLNTTIYPAELPDAARAVQDIAEAGADGVIVQDLAAARLVKRIAPSLPLHGSTQMSVHSLDGARMLARLGFSRVILARELSLEEIAHIAAHCGIETEVFVHGALCMSVSGQCWMSAFLGGRSGNRGACAGPCRLPFETCPGVSAPGERGSVQTAGIFPYVSPSGGQENIQKRSAFATSRERSIPAARPGGAFSRRGAENGRRPSDGCGEGTAQACHLSLKDLSILRFLPQLAQAGVVSAKIEGRLRAPEYVAAAVHAALLARDGEDYDENILQNVFSRSGFTDSYITGRRGASMFGVRTGEDAAAARAAAPKLRELYRRERPAVGLCMSLSLSAEGARLTVRDAEGHCSRAETGGPLCAGQKPPEEAAAGYRRSLEKTGGTPFFAREITVEGAGWHCPGGTVNELRRTALSDLLSQREAPHPLQHSSAEEALKALLTEAEHDTPSEGRSGDGQAVPLLGGAVGTGEARPVWAAHFEHVSAAPLDALAGAAAISFPLTEWREVPEDLRGRTWLFAPRAVFGGGEESVRRLARESAAAGFAGYVAQNIAQFETFRGLRVAGAFGLNITNALSAGAYRQIGACALTLSPELRGVDLAQIAAQTDIPLLALAYGHMPLMLTRACPLQNARTCAECRGAGELLDRKGKRFPVRCTGAGAQGARTIYNPVPLYWGDRLTALGGVMPLLYFTIEDEARAREVLARFSVRAPLDGPYTRGLYEKGTQERSAAQTEQS